MNTKGITIKVTTSKVIALLEDKLTTMEKSLADYPVISDKHDKAVEAWKKKCLSIAAKQATKTLDTTVVEDYSNNTLTTRVTYWFNRDVFPPKPEQPDTLKLGKYSMAREVEELQDIIRMLKLHEGDSVSTATYKSVARFL